MISRILLLMILVAPLGLASDLDQDSANSTGVYLSMISSGDAQASDLGSAGLYGWEDLLAVSSHEVNGSTIYTLPGLEMLLGSSGSSPQRFELSRGKDLFADILPNDAWASNSMIADYAHSKDNQNTSLSRTQGINKNLLGIYIKNNEPEVSLVESKYIDKGISPGLLDSYINMADSDSVSADRIANEDSDDAASSVSYYYEDRPRSNLVITTANDSLDLIFSDLNRIHVDNDLVLYASQNDSDIDPDTQTDENYTSLMLQYPHPSTFLSNLPNLDRIRESLVPESYDSDTLARAAEMNADLERINEGGVSLDSSLNWNDDSLPERASEIISVTDRIPGSGSGSHASKNYAVVVGINSYSDRMSLHTSVNDADKMAALLESYGYEVIKLTDQTDDRPTKDNILDKALAGLKQKKDLGKVLIYFSGHGEKMGNDYYLIPQNSDGQISSYISARELELSIKGLKSVALVVDACNSGELEKIADSDQLVLASSKWNEPSNEVWFGPLSLFTSNLYNAIKEEEKVSSEISLERCFYKAQEATERWSKRLLMGQTPQMKDNKQGHFYLN